MTEYTLSLSEDNVEKISSTIEITDGDAQIDMINSDEKERLIEMVNEAAMGKFEVTLSMLSKLTENKIYQGPNGVIVNANKVNGQDAQNFVTNTQLNNVSSRVTTIEGDYLTSSSSIIEDMQESIEYILELIGVE